MTDQHAALLKRSLDGLPSSIVTLDRDGVVLMVNETATRMLPSVEVGKRLRPVLETLTHREKVDRVLHHKSIATFSGVVGGPELHWIAWDLPGDEGETVLTVWETDWSDDLNEQRAAFAMAASHELRGPLTTLRGFAEILNMDRGNLTPEQAEAAEIIEKTSLHLTVLVDDVFDMSRDSFGELRLHLCDTDLRQMIRTVAATLEPRMSARDQTLEVKIEDGLPTVTADEARVTQVVTNLVNNAAVHNPPGTTVSVSARRLEGEVEIVVADDGQGLPFDDPKNAFRSFNRGETATEGDRTGAGIGLTITRLLVKLHLGEISVDSTPGAGTRFTVWLPIDREAALGGPARGIE
jgi:signal transduction histidine kinase